MERVLSILDVFFFRYIGSAESIVILHMNNSYLVLPRNEEKHPLL